MSESGLPRPFRSPAKTPRKSAPISDLAGSGHQGHLFSVKETVVDGIEMGVLSDGTPYLHLRGLAWLCGIDHAALLRLANNWAEEQKKPRGARIKEILAGHDYHGETLNIQASASEVSTHVYPDKVCMAILEYYAFDATQPNNDTALKHYRVLARHSLRKFIYDGCGYDPDRHIPASWRNFHERVLLNDQIPVGYFSVFAELADIVIHMIKAGCPFDSHTVPDISVGQVWGKHWMDNGFETIFGHRIKHSHFYPDWYPQSAVNPVEVWIYPSHALGQFHNWLQLKYLIEKFPTYIGNKVKDGTFLPARGEQLLEAVGRKALPASAKY